MNISRATCIATIILSTIACTTSTPFKGPSGAEAFAVNCRKDLGRCYEKAAEHCPKGYSILNAQTGTVIVPTGYGALGTPSYNVAVECK